MTETTAEDTLARRDPRSINHMDKQTRLVHAYLDQWGHETRQRSATGLPPITVMGRIVEQGPVAAAIRGHEAAGNLSDRSARVDACVCRLWKLGQDIIKAYYCTSAPVEAIAHKHKMSVRQLQESLRRSRYLIGAWLEDMDRNIFNTDLKAVI